MANKTKLEQLQDHFDQRLNDKLEEKTKELESDFEQRLMQAPAVQTDSRTSRWKDYTPNASGSGLRYALDLLGRAYATRGGTVKLEDVVGDADKTFAKRFLEPQLQTRDTVGVDNSSGGENVLEKPLFQEILQLIRNRTILQQLGVTFIGMNSRTLDLPRETSQATFAYTSESDQITKGDYEFDQKRLTAKKLAGVVGVTNDWIRSNPIGGQAWIMDRMVADFVVAMERHLLTGTIAADNPETLFEGIKTDNKFELTAASGTVSSLTDFEAKIDEMVEAVTGDGVNVPEDQLHMLMGLKPRNFLRRQRDNGIRVYPELREEGEPRFIDYPLYVSNMLKNDRDDSGQGDDDESRLYVGDFSSYWVGILADMELAVSEHSRFRNDEVEIRLVGEHDAKHTRDDRIAVLSTDLFQQ